MHVDRLYLACISLQVAGMICFWAFKTEILFSLQLLATFWWKYKSKAVNQSYWDILPLSVCSLPLLAQFLLFSICLRSFHLFVYSFKHVIQVHYAASIHLWRRHERKRWKIGLCSTFNVLKCIFFIEYKCRGWITMPFDNLGTWGELFVSMWQHLWRCHPAGTWAIHLQSCWIQVQNTYYMIETSCNWGNINLIASIIWMTPSKAYFCDLALTNYLYWQLFVT